MPLSSITVTIAATPTLVYSGDGGAELPRQVLVQNNDPAADIAIGGPTVVYATAVKVFHGGGAITVPLEAGEKLYAITTSGTVDVQILATRV